MIDLFIQAGFSNACFALALAIVAIVVEAKAKRPHLAHMLWLLVLVKLVTPPIVTIPIDTFLVQPEHAPLRPAITDAQSGQSVAGTYTSLRSRIEIVWNHGRPWLVSVWLLGSVVVFAWSLLRVFRFKRLLLANSESAPQDLQTEAERIASRLGLATIAEVCTTSARISPMVWWTGGQVRVVIPTTLLDQMKAAQWRWVLAHELAHVRRRDYMVRWLEWLACVCFWWNPVVWWARHNLRANEEICCDALVVRSLKPKPDSYAVSLLTAIECLARPVLHPPAMASEINSGGYLERRFKMIVSGTINRKTSRWLQAFVLLFATVVLPFGLGYAQDYKAVGKRLKTAVTAGELTPQQARAMMDALRRTSQQDERKGITREDYARAEDELRKAVAEGKISEEDARARLEGMRKEMDEQSERGSKRITREDYARVEADLKKAVAEGKIAEEDARARLEGMRKEMDEQSERGSRRITREDYARVEADLKKAVAEGKIAEEDARARLEGMRKEMDEQADAEDKDDAAGNNGKDDD